MMLGLSRNSTRRFCFGGASLLAAALLLATLPLASLPLATLPLASLPLVFESQTADDGATASEESSVPEIARDSSQQTAFASPQWGGGPQWGSGGGFGGRRGNRERQIPSRDSFPTWEISPAFKEDVFTFARVKFESFGPFGWHDRWDNDFPDADWNFSLRLQQLTSLQVNTDSEVLELTNPRLFDFPFLYFAGVQYMTLNQQEQIAFRQYLNNGGFFMMDDLWGLESLDNVLRQMDEVLPNSKPKELPLEHEVFHMVYDLKELPQVTDYLTWSRGYRFEYSHAGPSGDVKPHFLAYYDKHGRMVGLVCHNNDIGDGWEREGNHEDYFMEYSVKHSYPFGINLIAFVMSR